MVAGSARLAPGFAGWASRVFRRAQPDLASLEDGELLRRAARGDEGACRILLSRHGPRLMGVLEASGRSAVQAEDVVQETFLRAFSRADQLRDDARLFPWLVRIGLRVAVDLERKTRREACVEAPALDATDPDADPIRDVEVAQTGQMVTDAVARLPEHPRRLVQMRYFAHLSTAELAEVFDKSEVAIRKDLQRARAQLKEILQPWLEEDR